jgi:hypothetical protein
MLGEVYKLILARVRKDAAAKSTPLLERWRACSPKGGLAPSGAFALPLPLTIPADRPCRWTHLATGIWAINISLTCLRESKRRPRPK